MNANFNKEYKIIVDYINFWPSTQKFKCGKQPEYKIHLKNDISVWYDEIKIICKGEIYKIVFWKNEPYNEINYQMRVNYDKIRTCKSLISLLKTIDTYLKQITNW